MRIAVAVFFLFMTISGTAVSADSPTAAQNRFTSIANKDCTFAPIADEPGDEEDQLKTCPGVGGAQVLVNTLGTRLRIGFRWPKGAHPQKMGGGSMVRRIDRRLARIWQGRGVRALCRDRQDEIPETGFTGCGRPGPRRDPGRTGYRLRHGRC